MGGRFVCLVGLTARRAVSALGDVPVWKTRWAASGTRARRGRGTTDRHGYARMVGVTDRRLTSAFDRLRAYRTHRNHLVMRQALIMCCVAVFAASSASAKSPSIDRTMLIGTWAGPGASCVGDTAEAFRADGQFETDTSLGRWTLQGNQLVILITQAGEMGEAFSPVQPPERYVTTVLHVDRRTRAELDEHGTVQRSRRCR